MKRIIKGVAYNTDTSTAIATSQASDDDADGITIKRMEWTLYLTRGGAFFLHQREDEQHRDDDGGSTWIREDQFFPMLRNEAQAWVMEGQVEIYHDVFGEVPEAAAEEKPEATIYIRVPEPLKRQIDGLAKEAGQSVNAWATRCLERCAQKTDPTNGGKK